MIIIDNGTLKDLNDLGIFFVGPHVPSSKNSRVKTSRGIFPSASTTRWRKESKHWWELQRDEFLKQSSEPVIVGVHFIRKTRHKYDWCNPLQTIQDEMVSMGWLVDDNVTKFIPFPMRLNGEFSTLDAENSGVLLKIIKNDCSISEIKCFDLTGVTTSGGCPRKT